MKSWGNKIASAWSEWMEEIKEKHFTDFLCALDGIKDEVTFVDLGDPGSRNNPAKKILFDS